MPARSKADAQTTVTVTWRDQQFTVPAQQSWPVEVWESMEDGRFVATLRGLLGPQQWARFKAAKPAPVLTDMSTLIDQVASASGFGSAGESSASSD